MSLNLQAYEQQLLAKHHYRKLVAAKTTLTHFRDPKEPSHCQSRTLTPLDRYEYRVTNDKIRNKLVEIYQEQPKRGRSQRKTHRKHSKSVNIVSDKQKQKTIDRQNIKMFCRIVEARSVIGENWKNREKSLRKYSQITRKKPQITDNSLFEAYREILIESRAKTSKKSKKTRRSSSKCRSRPTSVRESGNEAIELRTTM